MKVIKDEKGLVMIEAAIVFPLMIFMIVALLLLGTFLVQRMNVQRVAQEIANTVAHTLANPLIEIRPVAGKAGVGTPPNTDKPPAYTIETAIHSQKMDGKQEVLVQNDGLANLYRYVFKFAGTTNAKHMDGYAQYVGSRAEILKGNGIQVDAIKVEGFLLGHSVEVAITQTFQFPINMGLLGLDNTFNIAAVGKATVNDPDELIRTVDLIKDKVEDTAFFNKLADSINALLKADKGNQ